MSRKKPDVPTKSGEEQNLPADDMALFRDAIGDVKPVNTNNRRSPDGPKPAPRVNAQVRDNRDVMAHLLDDFSDHDFLETGDHLAWTAPGLQRSELRKLKSGKHAIQAELDLHGLTREQAKSEVATFIEESRKRDQRCIRIIHGRGRKRAEKAPVLKPAVDGWLRHHKQVLAYCSARENDGGTGAVYVLLRRWQQR